MGHGVLPPYSRVGQVVGMLLLPYRRVDPVVGLLLPRSIYGCTTMTFSKI